MKKLLLLFTFLLVLSFNQYISAQERYLDNIFEEVDVQSDIVYGNNVTVFPTLLGQSPTTQDLLMDIYTPSGDTETNRPAVVLIHTGSFLPAILNGFGSFLSKYAPISFSVELNAIVLIIEPSAPIKTDLICLSLIILLFTAFKFSITNFGSGLPDPNGAKQFIFL